MAASARAIFGSRIAASQPLASPVRLSTQARTTLAMTTSARRVGTVAPVAALGEQHLTLHGFQQRAQRRIGFSSARRCRDGCRV